MAELVGFEPTHNGVKVRCLTAWLQLNTMVEVKGFEPSASWSQTKHSTKLSYTSKYFMVRMTGLEPAHLTAQEPKSCVSANFTTSALFLL